MNLNQVTLAGRVSSAVEMRYTSTGKPVTSFDLAINKGTGENQKTMYVRVTCWEKLAETVSQWLARGQEALVVGEMTPSRAYTRKDGELGASNEVTAFNVQFGARPKGQQGDDGGNAQPASVAPPGLPNKEDIPF